VALRGGLSTDSILMPQIRVSEQPDAPGGSSTLARMARAKTTGTVIESPAAPSSPMPSAREKAATAVLWAAVADVAKREGNRDDLAGGGKHDVKLNVVGEVDGQPIAHVLAGVLTVNHDAERASSTGPKIEEVVALLLAKMGPKVRQALVAEIVNQFEAGGELPPTDETAVELATAMLARLRTKKTTTARGSVRFEYQRLPQ
jgi:hypothetical protein